MKNSKLLLALVCTLWATCSFAQVFSNGAFETWDTTATSIPDGWHTSNDESVLRSDLITATQSTDSKGGMAIRLETKTDGIDTFFGYVINTKGDPFEGVGGVPYSQQAENITGYYKCGIQTGDSAFILVIFKKAGAIVSTDMFKLGGTQSTYTQFSFPLSLSMVPDSVIIGFASSDPMNESSAMPGSYLLLDSIAFTGTGVTQAIPGGMFNIWSNKVYDHLIGWRMNGGEGITRSTDKHKGSNALQLETIDYGGGDVGSSNVVNGFNGKEGEPFTGMVDTVVFYYKYSTPGTDSGMVWLNLKKNGGSVGGQSVYLPPAASYTMIEIPFNVGTAPDTVSLMFSSSTFPFNAGKAGSRLTIDEVQMKSQPLHTGIKKFPGVLNASRAYPNPASGELNISFSYNRKGDASVLVYDVTGRQVLSSGFISQPGSNTVTIDVSALNAGTYLYEIVSGTGGVIARQKFNKQ